LFNCFPDVFYIFCFYIFFLLDLVILYSFFNNFILSSSRTDAGRLFNNFQISISHNVRRYTTFGAGDRALRSNDPRPKCGGAKPHKGRRPAAVFGVRGAEGPEAYTGLLGEVAFCHTCLLICHIALNPFYSFVLYSKSPTFDLFISSFPFVFPAILTNIFSCLSLLFI
jgi:hypothetical protein